MSTQELWRCSEAVIRARVAAGEDVNGRDDSGWTHLMNAAHFGEREVVYTLLRAGVDVNAGSPDGRSALLQAVIKGHADVVEELLASHADVNAKTKNGQTPLSVAEDMAREGPSSIDWERLAKMLKRAGARR